MAMFIFGVGMLVLVGLDGGLRPWLARRWPSRVARIVRWMDFGVILVSSLVLPLTLGWTYNAFWWQLGYVLLFGETWMRLTEHSSH